MSIKICHLTSTHGNHDQRILLKECTSLSDAGYEVCQVAQGDGGEYRGVHLIGTEESDKRLFYRLLVRPHRVFKLAKALDADIYQIHDMELLPYAVKLKHLGKKVIFDYHEDFASRFADSDIFHLPKCVMHFFGRLYAAYEKRSIQKLDAMISVTPHICERLQKSNPNTVMITNYPMTEDPEWGKPIIYDKGSNYFCFAGQVSSKLYCLDTAIIAIQGYPNIKFKACGLPRRADDINALKALDADNHFDYIGILPNKDVPAFLSKSKAAIITCDYTKDTNERIGTLGNNKLFEAMLCGIPVICTKFKLWEEIVGKYHCGICVEPRNIEQLAAAMRYIIEHPDEAEQMGKNGRAAIEQEFNWATQKIKLLELYRNLAGDLS